LNVATASAKCITILAQRLGSSFFQQLSSSLVLAIGERFKDKRAVIRDPLVSCIDAVFTTTVIINF
jgi:hypothetical protein